MKRYGRNIITKLKMKDVGDTTTEFNHLPVGDTTTEFKHLPAVLIKSLKKLFISIYGSDYTK